MLRQAFIVLLSFFSVFIAYQCSSTSVESNCPVDTLELQSIHDSITQRIDGGLWAEIPLARWVFDNMRLTRGNEAAPTLRARLNLAALGLLGDQMEMAAAHLDTLHYQLTQSGHSADLSRRVRLWRASYLRNTQQCSIATLILDTLAVDTAAAGFPYISYAVERAKVLNCDGKPSAALDWYRRAYTLAQQDTGLHEYLRAETVQLLALGYINNGDWVKGKELLSELLTQLSDESYFQGIRATTLNNLGALNHFMGNYLEARELFAQALALQTAGLSPDKYPSTASSNLQNLAQASIRLGDLPRALHYYRQAIQLHRRDKLLATAKALTFYNNLANAHLTAGRPDSALVVMDTIQAIIERYQPELDLDISGQLEQTKGRIYSDLGQDSLATASFVKAERFYTLPEKSYGRLVELYSHWGYFFEKRHRYSEALSIYRQGLAYLQIYRPGLNGETINRLYSIGNVQQHNGDLTGAIATYEEALTLGGALNDSLPPGATLNPNVLQRIATELGETQLELYQRHTEIGHLHAALASFGLAERFFDYLRTFATYGESRQLLLEQRGVPIYQGAVEAAYRLGEREDKRWLDTAFYWSERYRGYHLHRLARLRTDDGPSGLPAPLFAQEQRLKSTLGYLEGELRKARWSKQPVSPAVREHYADITFALDTFSRYLEREYPAYTQLGGNYRPNLTGLYDSMANGRTLVEYMALPHAWLAFVVDDGVLRVHQLAIDSSDVQRLRQLIHDFPTEFHTSAEAFRMGKIRYTDIAQHLYQQLWEPLDIPSGREIVLAPDGLLHYLPFEALLPEKPVISMPFQRYPYLITKHEFVRVYSAHHFMGKLSVEPSIAPSHYIGFAPDFRPGATVADTASLALRRRSAPGMLFHNIAEVNQLNAMWRGRKYTGQAATAEHLLPALAQNDVVHLATHGTPHYLILADQHVADRFDTLFLTDLDTVDINSPLVILSACESGLGEYETGEGPFGLAYAMVGRGARQVLATQWAVDDESTASILGYFGQNFRQGISVHQALRQAQLNYLHGVKNEYLAHPFFWAGYSLIGNRQNTIQLSAVDNDSTLLMLLIGVISLFSLGLWVIHRFLRSSR